MKDLACAFALCMATLGRPAVLEAQKLPAEPRAFGLDPGLLHELRVNIAA
jgi:hypothetical protein